MSNSDSKTQYLDKARESHRKAIINPQKAMINDFEKQPRRLRKSLLNFPPVHSILKVYNIG
jgi:hypothetical protein